MYFKTPLTRTYATTATLQRLIGRPLLGRYRILPTDIFRIQTGRSTALRDYDHQMRLGKRLYDLHVRSDGLVHPVTGDFFEGPNGCLCRANGFVLKTLVRKFGSVGSTVVFRLPAGLELPRDLVLLHEHSDHHSLQCTIPLTLEDLNERLTRLFANHAEFFTRNEFLSEYGSAS